MAKLSEIRKAAASASLLWAANARLQAENRRLKAALKTAQATNDEK